MKKRESNIELLRIISMLMIIAHHFSVHSNFVAEKTSFTNNVWLQLLSSGGKIGVNIFILISGFFLINSKKVNINKFIKLLAQLLFYSITIFIVFVAFGIKQFDISDSINYFLGYPVWWFAKAYLVIYLFHPYINKLLNSLSKVEHKKLILISTIIISIIPTITTINADGGTFLWFIFLYSLGAYISKYPINLDWKASKYLLVSVLLCCLTFLIVIVFDYIGIKRPLFSKYAMYLFEMNKLPVLLISVFLFLTFKNMKIKYNKLINTISAATFGIYLLHDSYYVRPFLWQTIFKSTIYSKSYVLIPYSLLVIIIVFVGCLIIELIRIYLIEKNLTKFIDMLSNITNKTIDRIANIKSFKNI